MNESHLAHPLPVSAAEFLDALLQELSDQARYDPDLVALIRKHLGADTLHDQAGERLAAALIQLAQTRAAEGR